jgi:hypothetical protein
MGVLFGDLSPLRAEQLANRVAHLLEVETGFRSGSRLDAADGEPRAVYDPAATTVDQRRRAKVEELRALGGQLRLLGFAGVSVRSLQRMAAAYSAAGPMGLVDGRWVRRLGGHRSVTEPVIEALEAVRAETLHRSRVSMRTKDRMVRQFVAEVHGPEVFVPGYDTLRAVWAEMFGPGGGRQRFVRSAAAAEQVATGEHIVVRRPGQVVALDTTPLPVFVRESVFGEPVRVHLTNALDVYTHSLLGFRLTLGAEASVDVAMLLRDVATATPMRPGWGADMAWRYPGIPAGQVEALAGYPVAAVPFGIPETVTTDHGAAFKNHHVVAVQCTMGVNILPSRALRPTDKASCERAFAAVSSLLFEHLLGYCGRDVADRGADPDGDAVLSMEELEELIAAWTIRVWQNRVLAEAAPDWDPGGRHSPNTLFAAASAQGGFGLRMLSPAAYYELLPAHHVKIHGRRGVKIRGLWYDGPGLDPWRGKGSGRGGRHKDLWVVRRDPRDRRTVFFADPDGAYHPLRWNGLGPDDGEVPAFGDARVGDMLAKAKAAGLAPRSDAELLPPLLELLAAAGQDAASWPTRTPKPSRGARRSAAREQAAGRAAGADRAPKTADAEAADSSKPAADPAAVVDAERTRRRQQAVPELPPLPSRLGEDAGRRSVLRLAGPDAGAQ